MCSFNSGEEAYLQQTDLPPPETPTLQEQFFQNLTQFSQGNSVLDAPVLTEMVSFQGIHVLLHLS
jgi:hypothetical protein